MKSAMRGLASLYAATGPRDLRIIRGNLEAALGSNDPRLKTLPREVILNFSSYLTDLFYSHKLDDAFFERNVRVEGRENLEKALSRKKGLIVVSAHVGHWEMGAMVMARLGYPIHILALQHRDERIDAIFKHRRRHYGIQTIPVGHSMRGCFQTIEQNHILALNGDRLFTRKGTMIRFMGKNVVWPVGPAKMALATGAPLLTAFCLPAEKDRYVLRIEGELTPSTAEGMTQEYAQRVEAVIRQHPAHWLIFQPFQEAAQWPN